jgi:O-acetyl-ADP-ribose deacetylase (regulator of RNase III)
MLEILVADLTTLAVDAIVNAANPSLQGGGGVDGAIHAAAGPELARYNRALAPCMPGEVRLSPGFRLPARHVISTVGPRWQGGGAGESDVLAGCYREALKLARNQGLRSLAFPAISTGIYGFPREQAARIALTELGREAGQFDRLIACCHTEADAALYRAVLNELREESALDTMQQNN